MSDWVRLSDCGPHSHRCAGCGKMHHVERHTAQCPRPVRKVTGCGDCPASAGMRDGRPWCAMRLGALPSTAADTPPDWCPLRRGPVLLQLEET